MIVLQEQDGEKEVALSMDVPHMNNEHVECQHVKHLAYLPLSITPVANKLVSNKISAIINIQFKRSKCISSTFSATKHAVLLKQNF